MTAWSHWRPWLGALLWLALALPPLRHATQATMTLQMLVQIPMLAVVGWWLRPWWWRQRLAASVSDTCSGPVVSRRPAVRSR